MTGTMRIGTRGSQLALWQANEVSKGLSEAGWRPQIVIVKTTGDRRVDVPLATIGGKGLFIKELEDALERREIDIAVHSLKDVPSIVPAQFALTAFLERADPRDAWVQLDHLSIGELPGGATVGTSAPRRRAQLRMKYPHLQLEEMRGNVDSRINKLRAGLYSGAILASAGLIRLGRVSEITSQFEVDDMLPAAGQGIIAIETLTSDDNARTAAAILNHAPTHRAALAERAVLQCFGTRLDCYSAIAVHAAGHSQLTIRAVVSNLEGSRSIRSQHSGAEDNDIVSAVFEDLVSGGAEELLR